MGEMRRGEDKQVEVFIIGVVSFAFSFSFLSQITNYCSCEKRPWKRNAVEGEEGRGVDSMCNVPL